MAATAHCARACSADLGLKLQSGVNMLRCLLVVDRHIGAHDAWEVVRHTDAGEQGAPPASTWKTHKIMSTTVGLLCRLSKTL